MATQHLDTSLPGDLGRFEIEADKLADFLWRKGSWICFTDPQALETQRQEIRGSFGSEPETLSQLTNL